ncbi:hypothetical protein O3G_MSEX005737 [Manduca sexta]|uniref:Ubiquinone biosynthesis O-methyltransferase, mitochondrial n=1 Tax=Manduca sexta TaxID=7130 RepID=A0A921Z015_MANSE|nr:hypothetical protein O3G_MSEX005737 [Manduca sexta]
MSSAVLRMPWLAYQKIFNKTIASQTRLLSSVNAVKKDDVQTITTVDKSDVEFFSNQMNHWWELDGPLKALHSMNLIRIPFVRDGLVQCSPAERNLSPLRDKKILDVGCGGGILSEGLARLGATVTGIDASKDLIAVAEAHKVLDPRIENNKPTYYNITIEDHISKYSNYYDAVVASEVIEHVNNQELFVKSCVQALKPGGRIFFTTPNRTRLSQLLVIYLAENVLKLLEKGSHQYEKFITPNELTFLLERNNCHVESVYGILYHFLANSWEFVRAQSLMYAMQAVKLN